MFKAWLNTPGFYLFIGMLVAYGYFYQGLDDHTTSHLALTRALAEDGTVRVDRFAKRSIDFAYHEGHFYSVKGPTYAFLAAPFWKVLSLFSKHEMQKRLLVTVALSSVPGALVVLLIFLRLRKLSGSPRQAYLFSIAIGLGTPIFSYSTLYLQTPLVQLCLLSTLLLLTGDELHVRTVAFAGFLSGLAVSADYPASFLVLPFFAFLWFRKKDWKEPLLFGVGMVPSFGLLPVYNFLCYGNPFAMGNFRLKTARLSREMDAFFNTLFVPRSDAVWGLLFSLTKGLFAYSPFLSFAAVGLFQLRKQRAHRLWTSTILAGLILLTLFITSIPNWSGGLLVGPRYLLIGIPWLGLGLGGLMLPPQRVANLTLWSLLAISMVYSVLFWFAITSVGPFVPEEMVNPLIDRFIPEFSAARLAGNFGRDVLGLSGLSTLAPLVIVLVTLFAVGNRMLRDPQ